MTERDESTRARGQRGEARAADHLIRYGLEILARNVTAAGAEIDLIARDRETIVFVEVRKRSDDLRGHPLETIDARKQARIRRGATGWLVAQGLWERVAVRFDVIAIVGDDRVDDLDDQVVDQVVEWLRDAF